MIEENDNLKYQARSLRKELAEVKRANETLRFEAKKVFYSKKVDMVSKVEIDVDSAAKVDDL